MEYIWYNPDMDLYQIGESRMYKLLKRSSGNNRGFTLLYKMKPSKAELGRKLITELNRARVEHKPVQSEVYEFSIA